jgi:hypothetical protein
MAIDLAPDSLLSRTAEGTRKLSTRTPELTSKLRSALFLVSGRHTFGDLLGLAGGLAHVLEAQFRTLLDMGLIEVAGEPGARTPSTDELPVAGARIQLLKRIEATACPGATALVASIRAARTLAELAERAREATVRVQETMGREEAEHFWSRAKEILIHWRDRAAQGGR